MAFWAVLISSKQRHSLLFAGTLAAGKCLFAGSTRFFFYCQAIYSLKIDAKPGASNTSTPGFALRLDHRAAQIHSAEHAGICREVVRSTHVTDIELAVDVADESAAEEALSLQLATGASPLARQRTSTALCLSERPQFIKTFRCFINLRKGFSLLLLQSVIRFALLYENSSYFQS